MMERKKSLAIVPESNTVEYIGGPKLTYLQPKTELREPIAAGEKGRKVPL